MATKAAILTSQQEAVIAAMCEGLNQREAADRAEVAKETVTRWLKGDALFIATLNTRRRELWETQAGRLDKLRSKALDVLGAALDAKDPDEQYRAAVAILRAIPITDKPTGTEDSDLVEAEITAAKRDVMFAGMLAR